MAGGQRISSGPGQRQPLRRLLPPRRALRIALLFAFIAVACTFLNSQVGAFNVLERQAVSLRMSLWARRNEPVTQQARRRIVLVPISDDTFRDAAFRGTSGPPVPRAAHARVIRELKLAGASVISFDILFDASRPGDNALAAAVRESGRVVWAGLWDNGQQRLLLPNAELRRASRYIGHTRSPHSDGETVVDRFEAGIAADGQTFPALSVQTARLALGLVNDSLTHTGSSWHIGEWLLPTAPDNTFRISFLGKQGEAFPSVPYEQVYGGIARDPMFSGNGFFHDKIVLIGDTTALSRDSYSTPVGRMSGLEIHAHAVATLLERSFLRDAPVWFPSLALLTLMLLSGLLMLACRWLVAAAASAALLLAYFLGAIWLLTDAGLLLPVAMPLLGALAMALATGIERGWTEERERAHLRSVLGQYVSEQVSEDGAPSGKIALVFTDLEDSSAKAKQFGARFEEAREQHFAILRQHLRACNGFEVETAGDSLFAVFARAMDAVQFTLEAQHGMQAHPWPPDIGPLKLRVGIHFGEPFVRRDRSRLTYRGHDTNLAARICGAAGGGEILASEAVRAAMNTESRAEYIFRARGQFAMKGLDEETLFAIDSRGGEFETAASLNSA